MIGVGITGVGVRNAAGGPSYTNPWLTGITSGNFARVRAQRSAVKAATDELRVLLIGDSNVAGAGAGTSGTFLYGGARARSWLAQAVARLAGTHALPAQHAGFCSTNNIAANSSTYAAYDPRVTLTNATESGLGSLGGAGTFRLATTQPSTIEFAPGVTYNQVRVLLVGDIRNGNASVTVAGSVVGTVTGQTLSFTASIVDGGWMNCTRGSGSVLLTQVRTDSTQVTPVILIEVRDTTVPAVRFTQAGWAGGTITNFATATNAYSSLNMIDEVQPHLVVIAGATINDAVTGTALATWQARFGELLDKCAASSTDVLWTSGLWLKSQTAPIQANSEAIQAAGKAICVARGIPVLDMHERWKTGAFDTTTGMYYDTVHPTYAGYGDWCNQVSEVIALA